MLSLMRLVFSACNFLFLFTYIRLAYRRTCQNTITRFTSNNYGTDKIFIIRNIYIYIHAYSYLYNYTFKWIFRYIVISCREINITLINNDFSFTFLSSRFAIRPYIFYSFLRRIDDLLSLRYYFALIRFIFIFLALFTSVPFSLSLSSLLPLFFLCVLLLTKRVPL